MTLTQKLSEYMNELEQTRTISRLGNTEILMGFYATVGVTSETRMVEYVTMISNRLIPAYESVTRAIRKSRELNPRWKKNTEQVENEIEHTADVVGYR